MKAEWKVGEVVYLHCRQGNFSCVTGVYNYCPFLQCMIKFSIYIFFLHFCTQQVFPGFLTK